MCNKKLTIYYPLKCDDKYMSFAYDFDGILTSFFDKKDVFNFIHNSFLTEKECQEKCDELNKQ